MRWVLWLLPFLSFTHASPVQALLHKEGHVSTPVPVLDAEFKSWLEKVGAEWGMKGFAISVVQRDQASGKWTIEAEGYGTADDAGTPVTNEVSFVSFRAADHMFLTNT